MIPDSKIDLHTEEMLPPPMAVSRSSRKRRRGWGSIFLSAVGGASPAGSPRLGSGDHFLTFGPERLARMVGNRAICARGLAFLMILLREASGLLRLSAITALRRNAEAALASEDVRAARAAALEVRAAFAGRAIWPMDCTA